MPEIESVTRPLSETERRLLTAALKHRQRRFENFPKRQLITGLAIFGVLWAWTMIATHTKWYITTAIWAGIGSVILLWVYFSEKPKEKAGVQIYEDALRRNQARVTRIQSDEMVELEEEEDEGACYAFQLRRQRIVFVSGQDFYPSARFPNSDFSLVHIYGEEEVLVESFIEKHGKKLRPKRTISAELKSKLKVPGHLQVIEGNLDDLEKLLVHD
jgi:hypothetical protein